MFRGQNHHINRLGLENPRALIRIVLSVNTNIFLLTTIRLPSHSLRLKKSKYRKGGTRVPGLKNKQSGKQTAH
jgi:hypothetical protein